MSFWTVENAVGVFPFLTSKRSKVIHRKMKITFDKKMLAWLSRGPKDSRRTFELLPNCLKEFKTQDLFLEGTTTTGKYNKV